MVVSTNSKRRSSRLAKYGIAAVAATATGLTTADVNAAIVSSGNLGFTILSSNSVERFISLNGFAQDAASFAGFALGTSAASAGQPLGGVTDIMVRGFGGYSGGEANMRVANGGALAVTLGSVDQLAINVGGAGVLPSFGAGTYMLPGDNANAAGRADLWDPPGRGNFNGNTGAASDGFVYFTFVNKTTGLIHDGWLDITVFDGNGAGSMQTVVNEIFYNTTGTIPEPSSIALLCMGAAGLCTYRRRRKS